VREKRGKKMQEKQGIKDLTYFHTNAELEACQHRYGSSRERISADLMKNMETG